MSDKIELNRRRVLGGLVTIGAAGAAVGAGTFAYFSETAESQDNTIEAGTISLDDVTSTEVTIGPLVPEESTDVQSFSATYTGNIENPTLDWGIKIANDEDHGDGELAGKLTVTEAELSIGGQQVSNTTSGSLGDLTGVKSDVYDPTSSDLDLTPDDDVNLDLKLTLDNVDNRYQGATLDFAIAFRARQEDADALNLDNINVNSN